MKLSEMSMDEKMKKVQTAQAAIVQRLYGNEAFMNPKIELVNEKWESKPKSNVIKWLQKKAGIKTRNLIDYLDYSLENFNNRLNRNSFSIDDLLITAYACGFKLTLEDTNDIETRYDIDLKEYFEGYDDSVLKRIQSIEERETAREAVRGEYERMKAELEKMKQEYGFD